MASWLQNAHATPSRSNPHISAPTLRSSKKAAGLGQSSLSKVSVDDYAPDPDRKVYLVTHSKKSPLRRLVREIGRNTTSPDRRGEARRTDPVKDAVAMLGSHTDEFNDYLRKLPKLEDHAVRLVMQRMQAEGIMMTTETYNLLMEKVADMPGTLCYSIYEDLRANTAPPYTQPNLQTYQLLFRACERNGHFEKVFHYYTHMRAIAGLRADTALFNALIGYCALLEDESQAAFMIEEMKQLQVEPDVHTYNNLMNVFAEAPYDILLRTFEDMLKRKIKPNRRTYNSLMRACQRTGDYERAFQLFEELKHDGIVPDVVTYNILFVLCRDRLDFVLGQGAHKHLRRNREQREVGMKAVAELAMALIAEMDECSVLPNTFTYNAVLGVLGRCHDMRVFELFEQMKVDDRSHHASNPAEDLMLTWIADNAHMRSLPKLLPPTAEEEELAEVDEARIGGRGVVPNLDTYLTVIDATKRLGLSERAYALYEELKGRGIRPTRSAAIVMLDVCAHRRDKAKAYALMGELRGMGMRTDIQLHNSLLNVLAECADAAIFDELKRLRNDTDGLNVKPNIDTYNLVIKGCFRMRDAENALGTYRELCDPQCPVSGPDAVTYATLFDLCAAHKDTMVAGELMAEAKARGVAATIHTHCRYLNVFVQAGDDAVVTIFNDLKRNGPAPDIAAFNLLLMFYLLKQNPAILATFEELKTTGIDPDITTFNLLIDFAAVSEDHSRALRLFEELKTRGLSPDIETFNALLKCFAPSGSAMVHKIFEEMADSKIPPDHVSFSILMQHKAGCASLSSALDQHLVVVHPLQGSADQHLLTQ